MDYKTPMSSLQMITFQKCPECPSSQSILALRKGELKDKECSAIETHLESCEFCAAESDFYRRFPQAEEKLSAAQIPPHLYQLAEALLNNHHKESLLLDKLLYEDKVQAI